MLFIIAYHSYINDVYHTYLILYVYEYECNIEQFFKYYICYYWLHKSTTCKYIQSTKYKVPSTITALVVLYCIVISQLGLYTVHKYCSTKDGMKIIFCEETRIIQYTIYCRGNSLI